MIYGYARVSSDGQDRYGNSKKEQHDALRAAGAEIIYYEHFTGTKADRPEFNKVMKALGAGDMLIVTKIDRFSRSVTDGVTLIDELLERGVTVNILNMGIIDNNANNPVSKLMRTMLFAFAEFERDMIVTRTQEGKAIARQRPDYREGRPSLDVPAFAEYHARVERGELTVTEACKALNVSRSWWYTKSRTVA